MIEEASQRGKSEKSCGSGNRHRAVGGRVWSDVFVRAASTIRAGGSGREYGDGRRAVPVEFIGWGLDGGETASEFQEAAHRDRAGPGGDFVFCDRARPRELGQQIYTVAVGTVQSRRFRLFYFCSDGAA